MSESDLVIGLDVGSTTVKAVVVEPDSLNVVWHDYQRHHTQQPEKTLELLEAILAAFPQQPADRWRIFLTGSGSGPLVEPTGGKFVQEVNAVTLAVERKHPDVMSVIELGGQDAKIIMFKEDANGGPKTALASMNDKCASGTGATIDKCMIKVDDLPALHDVERRRAFHRLTASDLVVLRAVRLRPAPGTFGDVPHDGLSRPDKLFGALGVPLR